MAKTSARHSKATPRWPHAHVYLTIDGERHYASLWAHQNGQWCKKRGKRAHYFGPVADPNGALRNWQAEWPAIVGGEPVARSAPAGVTTIKDMAFAYLDNRSDRVSRERLAAPTLRKYRHTLARFAACVGPHKPIRSLTPADFEKFHKQIAAHDLTRQSDMIATVRGAFGWARANHLIGREPKYGDGFIQPSRALMRAHRAKNGKRPISREHLLTMLLAADAWFEPVLLLGINCGMKSMDIATFDLAGVDFATGWMRTTRRKTNSEWECLLWPETVASIRSVAHDSPPYLRTESGLPWNGRGTDRVAKTFAEMRDDIGLPKSVTHGCLRHTLRTVGNASSRTGVRRSMGQLTGDVLDEIYDHASMDDLLVGVSVHVRKWLLKTTPRAAASAVSPDVWEL